MYEALQIEESRERVVELVGEYGRDLVDLSRKLRKAGTLLDLSDERTVLVHAHRRLTEIIEMATEARESIEYMVGERSTIELDEFHAEVGRAPDRVLSKRAAEAWELQREWNQEAD